ncbi:FliM/FliN family flagellar motor switch protein [Sphingomonas koreensis]|uniref:FliM/FliN family flagellar motor switch protein n=1 Tax=Sphingomonas koreensis TaxID=93064 RepID=UPI000829DB89|nr:FliM/FliN family flagellar motor switch protein [Sphingomonas koreensis]PJI88455.1 flagellar motor switch protein FliN/FliY [Sphingomonas koreensis]
MTKTVSSSVSNDRPTRVSAKIIENVSVELEALLGTARLTVADLSALQPGDAVPLTTALNEVVELRLGGAVVARGELVAVDEKFGVRLTEIGQWPE